MNVPTIVGQPDLANVALIDHNVIPFTRRCMSNGLGLDKPHFAELAEYLDYEIGETGKLIAEYVPTESLDAFTNESMSVDDFNPDSPDQIGALLFKHLNIGAGKELTTTKSGNRLSTGKKQLGRLRQDHPIIPIILQRREYKKLITTYARKLPELSVWSDELQQWRLHYNIGLTFASTGRMTCSRLHQIPIRTDLGQLIRMGLIPRPGKVFISIDFSQIELRVLAHNARERRMMEIFWSDGDIHQVTQDGLPMPEGLNERHKRIAAKKVNFSICIAQGQRVLTDQGLVPIEKLTTKMLVWDGVEWVSHQGVVCNGYREVVTYQGVTATADHKVWISDGRVLPISEAMADGLDLTVTAIEESPVRYDADRRRDILVGASQKGRNLLHKLSPAQRYIHRRFVSWQTEGLLVSPQFSISRSPTSRLLTEEVSHNSPTVQQSKERFVFKLWRSRYSEQIQERRRIHRIHTSRVTASDLQEVGNRPKRQQWTLREGQFTLSHLCREQSEHQKEYLDRLQRRKDSNDGHASKTSTRLSRLSFKLATYRQIIRRWRAVARSPKMARNIGTEASRPVQKALVYDIINAGPRHRFTCEGKLVSNCFGVTDLGMYLSMEAEGIPVTREHCAGFINGWYKTYPDVGPYVSQQHYRARRYGMVWSLFGRQTPVPETRSVHRRIVAEGLRRAQNYPIQCTAGDIFKIAAAEVNDFCSQVRAGLFGKPYHLEPLLPIHDQILFESDPYIATEVAESIGYIMSNCVNLRVPVKVDWSIQPDCWKK